VSDSIKKRFKSPRFVIAVELDKIAETCVSGKPHLYVTISALAPTQFLESLLTPDNRLKLPGKPLKLRQDLIPKYKPSREPTVVKRRLSETKQALRRRGHAVNGDCRVWSVYVLDLDPYNPTPIVDRGKKNHVVYVGQTSKDIGVRLKEHRGEAFGKNGKYLGSRRTKGRNPKINKYLTLSKKFFSQLDAENVEVEYSHKLKKDGYRVLGDGLTDPAKRSRKKESEKDFA
jgi:hypothetical protein